MSLCSWGGQGCYVRTGGQGGLRGRATPPPLRATARRVGGRPRRRPAANNQENGPKRQERPNAQRRGTNDPAPAPSPASHCSWGGLQVLEVDDEGHGEGNGDGDGTSTTTPAGHVGAGARDKTATRTPGEGEGEGENDHDDDSHTTPQPPPQATARGRAGTGRREPRMTPPHPHALHEGGDIFYLSFLLIYLCRPSRVCVRGRLFMYIIMQSPPSHSRRRG